MKADTIALYLQDLGVVLKEKALSARLESQRAVDRDRAFSLGYLMAFHEVISIMQQQALAFGLDLQDISLDDINPEHDLV